MKRVAFAGLGAMGKGMAGNVLRAGFPLAVYDVRPEPGRELAALGARAAATAREAAAEADIFILMVVNHAQAEQVLFGPEGAAAALRPGATVVLLSTVAPAAARRLGENLAGRGLRFLDAPVSGGTAGAAAGTLTIMVGGPAALLEECRDVLAAMGRLIRHAGEQPGAGEAMKIVNNLLVGVTLAASAEALTLATKLGLDPRLTHEVLLSGAADSWVVRSVTPRMLTGDYTNPAAQLNLFVKDLAAALEAGDDVALPLPLASSAYQQFLAGAAAGWGAEDDAAVVKVYERTAGARVCDA